MALIGSLPEAKSALQSDIYREQQVMIVKHQLSMGLINIFNGLLVCVGAFAHAPLSNIALWYAPIFLMGIIQLRRAPNLYQFLLGAGAIFFISLQALINLGVVTGCLPTKGISLPFISYGGSNLVIMFILIGLILNLFRQWARPFLGHAREFQSI